MGNGVGNRDPKVLHKRTVNHVRVVCIHVGLKKHRGRQHADYVPAFLHGRNVTHNSARLVDIVIIV